MTHIGRRRLVEIVVALAAVALVAGVAVVPAGAGTTAAKTPTKIGKGEGQLDLVAWEGYVESGQNSPDANWVQPFEQETGCTVHVTYKPTSDEMVTAMESGGGGQFDGVSASGDASNRLIADGTVAPVNVKLLKNFKNIAPNLQSPPNNTVGGKHYGPSFMWGGNVLLYNTSKVTPKPDSWSIVFDKNTPYAGSLTAYDGPIYIADAALYLKATQPSLKIKDPYELTQKQFDAAVQLLKDQHPNVKKYWGLISDEIDTFASGEVVAGQSWPYQVVALKRDGKPADSVVPKEGMTGWSDTWMISSKAKHPNCMYKWMDYTLRPDVQASVATYVQYSPAVPDACTTMGQETCDALHVNDKSFFDSISFWKTPLANCGDKRGNKCVEYKSWSDAWTEIRG